jgi:hypothetical protein
MTIWAFNLITSLISHIQFKFSSTRPLVLVISCAINKPEPVLRLAKSVFTGKNGVHRRVLAAAGAQPTDRMCRFRLWMGQVWQIPDPPLENLVSFLSMGFDAV